MNTSRVKRLAALTLLTAMVLSFTGCSDFLKGLTEYRIEKRLETFSDEITEDYVACLEEYSATENEMPEMIDEQKEISDYAFEKFSMTVSSISITDNRKKATISFDVEFIDGSAVFLDDKIVTVDEAKEMIDDSKVTKRTMRFKMSMVDKVWMFDDLTPLTETLFEPFTHLIILDSEGRAINPSAEYYSMFVVDCLWYDPMTGLPLSNNICGCDLAVQCYIYFNQIMVDDFNVELWKNDSLIYEGVISVNNDVTVCCDFSAAVLGVPDISNGTYVMKIVFEGETVFETQPLTVN